MNGLVTVLRREVGERWQVLPGALVAGLLPLFLPVLLTGPAARSGELQVVMSLTAAGLLAGWLAAGLGSNVLNGPLFSGRLSFYWTRPIGGWAVWAGTLGAAVLLALAAGALALLPGVLLGGAGPAAALEVLREAMAGSVLLVGEPELPSNARVLGLVVMAALVLVLLGHATATLVRMRSWLLLDIAAALAIGLALASAVDRLASAGAGAVLRLLGVGLAMLLLAALLAATAAQVVIGRNDAVRGRRWLATVLWATLAAGAAAACGTTAWALSPTPSDLIMAWGSTTRAGGQHAFLAGPVRGRGEYQAAFLVNLGSGEFSRIGGNQDREPASVAFGLRCAVWITGTPGELWVTGLTDPIREGAPTHRPLAASLPFNRGMPSGELVASDDCLLVAVADAKRLVLVETSTGRLLASVTPPESQGWGKQLVFAPGERRLYILRTVSVLGDGVAAGQSHIEVWALRTDEPGAQPEPIARSEQLPANASALLLPAKDRVLVRYRTANPAESAERRILTFPDLRPVALLRIQEGCQGSVLPLATGLLAMVEHCGADHRLRLFAADGSALRSFALPRARQFRAGSQPTTDFLLLGVYTATAVEPSTPAGRSENRNPVSFWRTLLLDLRTGETSPVGDGLLPVFAGLGPENPAARLLTSSTERLLLFDPVSGESRALPGSD